MQIREHTETQKSRRTLVIRATLQGTVGATFDCLREKRSWERAKRDRAQYRNAGFERKGE